jgi:peptidoglycan/xylan/chitin deacetylase (PgdA/CDA1 family)
MAEVTRRQFVMGLLASASLVGTSRAIGMSRAGSGLGTANAAPQNPTGPLLPPPPPTQRVALPGGGQLHRLPGNGDLLALTLDGGANSEVVRRYTQFAKTTGLRLTYFVNGVHPSWRENAPLIRPLVDSGQIQLGNHTWSHADLTMLGKDQIATELRRNHQFLRDTYGVDATPYFRPPHGNSNATVESVATDLGYRVTTLASGSLADAEPVTQEYIVEMANKYFIQQNIVAGHLNYLPATEVHSTLLNIIQDRGLRTVTLNDVFLQPEVPRVVSG